ncbi:hypothetical protein DSM100688_0003 [Bifidobacterium ramosum]|uniref:DUF4191 family protein n=1 Tax=Bifidobacterium ramosum TaxID=1798158 RepID=A0A6L4X1M7_9BIFI|nr:DUF4191 domain-containing protein [Bifidobacterium ramosum]KAB8288925.1 hypothetical protein DSM100688_0003 [Bifidobacterium ramosum]NEG70643.1 DUF4191 family protein [Bifidobacterium ramosum]
MAEKDGKAKKNGLFSRMSTTVNQIKQIYKYTAAEDKSLPWLVGVALGGPIVVFIILGIVFRWSVISWILLMITAIMLAMLLGTMVLTNRADRVGYMKLEGRPGAAVSVLKNINKAGFNFPDQPVWIDPRTKDMIWRGTGYNGIYLLGEGDYDRVKHAMERQEQRIKGVTAGSQIPVYRIYVGTGANQTRLKDLRKTVVKQKAYRPKSQPTGWWDTMWYKIKPTTRFILTKDELETLNKRLDTLQSKTGYGIPKGIDPNRPQRVSRRAMRGK